jgi:hypothetical protein
MGRSPDIWILAMIIPPLSIVLIKDKLIVRIVFRGNREQETGNGQHRNRKNSCLKT